MPSLHIYIDPPVTGLIGNLYYIWNGNYEFVAELPPSENGAMLMSITASSLEFAVIFPRQLVEGRLYEEVESAHFTLDQDVTLNVTLTEVVTPPAPFPLGLLALAAVAGLIFLTRK